MQVRIHPKTFAAIVAISLVGALPSLFKVENCDTFFHLAAGRQILRTFSIPALDTFSYTFRGEVWHNHSPLFQAVIAAIEQAFGFIGLSLFQWILTAVLIILAVLSAVRSGAPLRIAMVLAVLPGVIFHGVVVPRPHVFGFLLLEICLLLVISAERDEKAHRLYWLPIVYLLWLGSHGSNIMQLLVMGTCFAGAVIQRNRTFALTYGGALLVCVGTALFIKPSVFSLAGAHVESSFLIEEIPEWHVFSLGLLFGNGAGIGFMALWMLSMGGLLVRSRIVNLHGGPLPISDRLPAHQAVLLFGVMAMSLTSFRMAPLFLIGAAPLWLPLAAWTLKAIMDKTAGRFQRAGSLMAHPWVLTSAPVFLCVGAVLACLYLDQKHTFGVGFDSKRFPVAAVAKLDRLGLGKRVYNAYNWGGYLMIARTRPSDGVFVDGRAITLYSPKFLKTFVAAYADPAIFELLVEKYRSDSVLMPVVSKRTGQLLSYLDASPRWKRIHADEVSRLYVLSAHGAWRPR